MTGPLLPPIFSPRRRARETALPSRLPSWPGLRARRKTATDRPQRMQRKRGKIWRVRMSRPMAGRWRAARSRARAGQRWRRLRRMQATPPMDARLKPVRCPVMRCAPVSSWVCRKGMRVAWSSWLCCPRQHRHKARPISRLNRPRTHRPAPPLGTPAHHRRRQQSPRPGLRARRRPSRRLRPRMCRMSSPKVS